MTSKREALSAKVAALTAKNAEHPTTKTERQLGEETRNLAAAEKRLNEAAEFAKDGDVLPAAASLFVEHPREVIYLFSGSVEQYKPFYASALIQHDAMLHFCVEHGLSRYNFYGIDGVFDDPDDEGRGVLAVSYTHLVMPLSKAVKTRDFIWSNGVMSPKLCQKPSETAGNLRPEVPARL